MSYVRTIRSQRIRHIVLAAAVVGLAALSALGAYYYCLYGTGVTGIAAPGSGVAGSPDKYRKVIRATYGLNPGDAITPEVVELVEVPEDLIPEGAVTNASAIEGMRIKYGTSKGEIIMLGDLLPETALYDEDDRLIEHNFPEGSVPASVGVGSLIDIKLFKPGGEDCVVVSKAVVLSRNANLLSFYLNSREQEYLKESAAEGLLFAVCYINDTQNESSVTYKPAYITGSVGEKNNK